MVVVAVGEEVATGDQRVALGQFEFAAGITTRSVDELGQGARHERHLQEPGQPGVRGDRRQGEGLLGAADRRRLAVSRAIATVTADAGYAYAKVYGGLERRGIDPLIPAKKELIKSRAPTHRFRYHARHDIVKCPRGKVLRSGRTVKYGCFFHSRTRDCARCTLKGECLSKGRVNKAVVIGDDYSAPVRARRRRAR